MRPNHSDTRVQPAVERRHRRLRNAESGQATTEFALILLPLLIVVGGIIYFGIGLNYWLDMNRVANQGARWAAVNNWPPYCLRTDDPTLPVSPPAPGCNTTTNSTPCSTVLGTAPSYHSRARLQDVLRCTTRASGNPPTICYVGVIPADAQRGDAVRVKLTAPYKFWFVRSVSVTLTATATMRLEQKPTLISNPLGPTC